MERKIRNDKGTNRKNYNSTLPSEFRSYKMRANKKGIVFSLSLESFNKLMNSDCYYCGEEYCENIGRLIDSSGYTSMNSIPCCSNCLELKGIMNSNSFLKLIKKIYLYQNQEE